MVSTQGQVTLYHAGDPTTRSWCRSWRETSNKSTALCCKAACVLNKPVVSEACEVKRAACWDLKHIFPITDSDNTSKAELNNIPFQLYCGFRSYSRSNASNNCGEIRMHRFPARASKTGTTIFLWINKPSSRRLPDNVKSNVAILYHTLKKMRYTQNWEVSAALHYKLVLLESTFMKKITWKTKTC